ncbi:MAG: glycosyltransferase [Nitrospinota bacterium]
MRILTFNWHEAYISALAKTGHQFEVIEQEKGGSSIWFYETRPVPPNVLIVKKRNAEKRLADSCYDTVLCHNINDFLWAKNYQTPLILLFHNKLSTLLALGNNQQTIDDHRSEYEKRISEGPPPLLVFISKSKKEDWGFDGEVITPGIDGTEYPLKYTGEEPKVLRVGNFMKNRDLMMGYSAQKKILGDIPSTLLGLNEQEEGARFTRSWEDLKNCYCSHRVYLNTTVDGNEDGYNLAMLEAMASGMPVVSTQNSTSPIRDGVNGFVSSDYDYLRNRILSLLNDREEASRIGRRARKTVETDFGIADFVDKWNRVLTRSAGMAGPGKKERKTRPGGSTTREKSSKNVLLAYVSYPVTTARYFEKSLRKIGSVVTVGPEIGEDIIKAWNLENMKEPVKPQDISCGNDVTIPQILTSLPEGWSPELFLWIESVYGYFPGEINRLGCPTACYLIDSHINLSWHLKWALNFDYVFVAQREYIPAFKKAGCSNVDWLPLACDAEIHGKIECEKIYDIGFVGSITANHTRRKNLLECLSRKGFQVHIERSFLKEMTKTFSSSKIVFNNAIKNDLNMRVFEALASGSFLLTDRAAGSGLEEMFTNRKHLVIFEDNDIEKEAEYYLKNESEREEIAAAGMEEVLSKHTYDHRALEMLGKIFEKPGSKDHSGDEVEDLLLKKALLHVDEKKFEQAFEFLTYAMNGRELRNKEWFELHCGMGVVCLNLKKNEEGRVHYEKAASLFPASEKPWLGKGAYFFSLGDHGKAALAYREALKRNKKSVKAMCGLGIATYFSGSLNEGFEYFREALRQDPENKMSLFYLIKGGYELEQFSVVEDALEKYLELHPADTDMLFALAGVNYRQNKPEKAKTSLDTILMFQPDHKDALDLLKKMSI